MLEKDRIWLDKKFADLRKELVVVQVAIGKLQVKAGIWGLFGGAIPIFVTAALYFFLK